MMNAAQKHLISDYLRRYGWTYAIGVVIHFGLGLMVGYESGGPVVGVIAGSGFVLGIEFMRGSNSTARTLLSMPMTAAQLAWVWRFVALVLPVVMFLLVLLLGVMISGKGVTPEEFMMLAWMQTGVLGMIFFALTGLQTAPNPGGSLLENLGNVFFGMLWGLSIPMAIFIQKLHVDSFSEMTVGHMIAWGLLTVITVAGYFRAETLVSRSAKRRGLSVRRERGGADARVMPWAKFGGLRYYAKLFGSATTMIFMSMLVISWFMLTYLFGGGIPGKDSAGGSQLNMFLPMIALVSMFQYLPMLRVLRTVPGRRGNLAAYMVLWPFMLVVLLSAVGHGCYSLVSSTTFDLGDCALSVVSGAAAIVTLPIFLRFGMNFKTMLVLVLVVSVSAPFAMLAKQSFGADFFGFGWLLGVGMFLVLGLVWVFTFRVLGTAHPWRSDRFRFGYSRRTV